MIDLLPFLIVAGWVVWFIVGWKMRGLVVYRKYNARILDMEKDIKILKVRVEKAKGKWLHIDRFIDMDGPVDVYECNVCALEVTDDSAYCPDCGSIMEGVEETPEGNRRIAIADAEVID